MSDQHPSYGHPNYASHWPPAYPSMIPPGFPVNSDYSQISQMPSTNPGQPFDYNLASVNANSRIAGSSGPGNPALFFPPQFPFYNQFDASQYPPPFPPMPFAPAGYHPAQMPTGPPNAALARQDIGGHGSDQPPASAVHPHPNKVVDPIDNHREEGEVSEEADERSLRPMPKDTRQYSDMEEGETISSSARSASSGSRITPNLALI